MKKTIVNPETSDSRESIRKTLYYGKLTFTGDQEKLVRTIIFHSGEERNRKPFIPFQTLDECEYSNDVFPCTFEISAEEGAGIKDGLDNLPLPESLSAPTWSFVFVTVTNGQSVGKEWLLDRQHKRQLSEMIHHAIQEENKAGRDYFPDDD